MRWLLKSLVLLLLGLPLLAAFAWFVLQQQMAQAGVSQLSFQLRQLTLHQLQLQHLSFRLDGKQPLTAKLDDLTLEWRWPAFFRPQLAAIRAEKVQLQLQAPETSAAPATPLSLASLPTEWQLPAWLPQQLQLNQITLDLPCPTGQCQLTALARLTTPDRENWLLQVVLSSPAQQLTLAADIQLQLGNTQQLQATIQLPEQFALSLKQQQQGQQASTELALALSPPSAAMLALLSDWQLSLPAELVTQFTEPVQMFLQGDWQLPTTQADPFSPESLPLQSGDFRFLLRAPTPVLLPGIGLVKGDTDIQLAIADAAIKSWQVNAGLELSALQIPLPVTLPAPIPAIRVIFNTSASGINPTTLPLSFKFQSVDTDPLSLQLDGSANLLAQLSPSLSLALESAELRLTAPQMQLPAAGISLNDNTLISTLQGHWQSTGWQLEQQSQLSTALLTPQVKALLTLQLPKLQLSQQQNQPLTLNSIATLQLQQLEHAALHTTDWQLRSTVSGDLQALQIQGELSNAPGLSLQYQAQLKALQQLTASWQLADIFLLAGNPLQDTISAWPELLTLQRGRLSASGQLRYPATPQLLSAQLQLRELHGLYDRTLFNNLSAQADLALDPTQLTLSLPQLSVQQLNHGMTLGPLQMVASYHAELATLTQGQLDLKQLHSAFLLGRLSVNPRVLDFSESQQQIEIQLQQLDLAELLRQHPATDVVATGKISGQIPLQLNAKGQLSVSAGQLRAEAPGGQLQYRNPAATASSNPGMKLVFDALEDFHFSLLNSEVSYQTDGTLKLGLQLQGFNPTLQQGRAINLNINLEEDIPAMLASLQLAGKLNDTLTKRVQQVIQQRQAARQAAGAKP